MIVRLFIIALCFATIISCKNEVIIKEAHFNTGKLQSKSYYFAKNDTVPFKKIMYNQDGVVTDTLYYNNQGIIEGKIYTCSIKDKYEQWVNYKSGHRDGLSFLKYTTGIKIIRYWKNDSINGIQYTYDKQNRLVSRMLWINSKPLYENEFLYLHPGDTTLIQGVGNGKYFEKIQILKDSTILEIFWKFDKEKINLGSLQYNTHGRLLHSLSNSYARIELKDTVHLKESLEVSINGYFGDLTKQEMNLDIYNINIDKNKTQKIYTFKGQPGDYSHKFKIDNLSCGYNVIVGDISLLYNGQVVHVINVFEDYYVLSSSSS